MDYSERENNKQRKDHKANGKKVRNKVGTIIFRVILAIVLIGGFALCGAAVGVYLGVIKNAPTLDLMEVQNFIYPSIVYDDKGNEIDILRGKENRKYATQDEIPQMLKDAFVAIEDERFYTHNGVDFKGMLRAVYTNFTTDRSEGASTITQQLIKNNVAKIARNTIITKIQEQYLAVEYEKRLVEKYNSGDEVAAKEEAKAYILELYLNTVNMHYSLNGVQTAANYYFNKDVSDLSLSECAVIASITQNPSKNNPITKAENNKRRQSMVLDKMLELEMITQDEHDEAMKDEVYERVSANERITEESNSYHSYFVDAVIDQVLEDLQDKYDIGEAAAYRLYNSGYKIYTTQNMEMQEIMDDAFKNPDFFPKSDYEIDVKYYLTSMNTTTSIEKNHSVKEKTVKKEESIDAFVEEMRRELLGENDEIVSEKIIPVPQPQAAMIVIDYHNGHVKALTGGRGEKMLNRSFNRAVNSVRQPGSVFKVLASFAPGIDMGKITPSTVIVDAPYDYKGYKPKNWYSGYKGSVTIRDAIKMSMNVVTVKNMVDVGIDNCFQYLLNFGFTTLVDKEVIDGKVFTDRTAAASLGGLTRGVTQIEVTAAYGTIANNGRYEKPIFYTKVLSHNDEVILENEKESKQVLKAQSSYVLTDMMKDVLISGTGTKARLRNTKMPVAGKTGTTTDTKDLTFVGYTPYYVAGVWLGFDQPKSIREDRGYHMFLWRDVMERIHKDLPVKDFDSPEGLARTNVCSISGKVAVAGLCSNDPRGNMIETNSYIAGSQVNDLCDAHISAKIDRVTKKKASSSCHSAVISTVVGVREGFYGEDSDNKRYEIPNSWIDGPECTCGGTSYVPPPKTSDTPALPDLGPQTGSTAPPTIPVNTPVPVTTRPNSTPPPTVPTNTPVPDYTQTPVYTLPPETPPPNVVIPDQPIYDEPSRDDFNF